MCDDLILFDCTVPFCRFVLFRHYVFEVGSLAAVVVTVDVVGRITTRQVCFIVLISHMVGQGAVLRDTATFRSDVCRGWWMNK